MDIKCGVIIPDRNDRPKFLENCIRMIENQTIQPTVIKLVNDPTPAHIPDGKPDITWRYRTGYDYLSGLGLDCILFMENDDYYAPDFIETMVREWDKAGRPNLFGTDYTIYYHIKLRKHEKLDHFTRSSAMSTLIKPDMSLNWGKDENPYTDSWLWLSSRLNGVTFHPDKHICLGIKHGVGMCGGRYHVDEYTVSGQKRTGDLNKYKMDDLNFDFLRQHMDSESYEFYTNYFK